MIRAPDCIEIASGLQFPEGPVWCSNASILLVEIRTGVVTRIGPDGDRRTVAICGGGPNGLAVGPDRKAYVCNNGGFEWRSSRGRFYPGHQAERYVSGSIQRIDPVTGDVETLHTQASGGERLRGPNDIVFDASGGYWFTDLGKSRPRERDITGVFYAASPDSAPVETIFPLEGGPNGIGLSPDGSRLYVAETYTGRLFFWELDGPGKIRPNPRSTNGGYYLGCAENGAAFDSLAVDSRGAVCVATPGRDGGVTVFFPDGAKRLIAMDDPMTTNICFGGPDLQTAFITLSLSGRLVAMPWDAPGHRLAFSL